MNIVLLRFIISIFQFIQTSVPSFLFWIGLLHLIATVSFVASLLKNFQELLIECFPIQSPVLFDHAKYFIIHNFPIIRPAATTTIVFPFNSGIRIGCFLGEGSNVSWVLIYIQFKYRAHLLACSTLSLLSKGYRSNGEDWVVGVNVCSVLEYSDKCDTYLIEVSFHLCYPSFGVIDKD